MVQHESDQSGEEHADERGGGPLARTVRLISGDYLLTVNPVDGSEIEPCPPGQRPGSPRRRAAGERPEAGRPGTGRGSAGVGGRRPVLLERDEERERLTRLLGRGRSVRLTGPRGSGRTALLEAVAADAATLAPDGVIRLSGYRRGVTDVLQDLFSAVHDAPALRPDRRRLREALSSVGAVVVLDDLEFGASALDELLTATPECAYLVAATPDVAAPSEGARIEEVFLPGLSRTASLELLEHRLGRPLTDDESDWAGDLWFLSEGNPLSFVQAGTLLRQRGGGAAVALYGAEDASDGRLPSGADLAADVASGLSGTARDALRIAAVLGGELPRGTHLPALLGEDHADHAPDELADAGLVTEAGGHYRLAGGVAGQLAAGHPGDGDGDAVRAETVAQHYAWWVAHPSVSAARVGAEADVVVAAVQAAQRDGKAAAAVLLARSAAPVLAAALRWGPWERVLRSGQEAARRAGEVAEQGYFHHELGVLALCQGNPERARTELDASVALRAALADQHGTVAGRRALALVTDRLAAAAAGGAAGVTPGTPDGPTRAGGPTASPASPPETGSVAGAGSATGALGAAGAAGAAGARVGLGKTAGAGPSAVRPAHGPDETPTSPTPRSSYGDGKTRSQEEITAAALSTAAAMDDSIAALRAAADEERGHSGLGGRRGLAVRSTRKNVLAAGAGAVLAAVLGTVALTAASDSSDTPRGGTVQPDQSDTFTDDWTDDPESGDGGADRGDDPSRSPGTPGPSSSATPSPSPSEGGGPPADPSPTDDDSSSNGGGSGGNSGGNGGGGDDDDDSPSPDPTDDETTRPPTESPSPSDSPTPTPTPTESSSGGGEGSSSPTADGPPPSATASGASPAAGSSATPVD
ncbi:ATP-binding protein [Streptomyces sp. DSM 42041]|uniref:ATP-binding protein n=1 Tax=Streptomyces hazeniae TaxID=3075538 RepID=A0ABU2NXX4_9ACTN|nr:ATP-binding protein [Streptomyces sp. DSM 42041]MDT0380822.1 ATP-binding protein [Streptomyces sp. DSM 42041]